MAHPQAQAIEPLSGSKPTGANQRLDCLDVLRGFAVLAIFAVNVKMMANGYNHYVDKTLWDGTAAPLIAFALSKLVHGKFVTIFTVLFGAGLALLLDRDKPLPKMIVLRRLFWLTVFGGLHLVFIREGDILGWYALTGFLAMWFARLPAQSLLAIGLALQAVAFFYFYYSQGPEADVPVLWRTTPNAHEDVAALMLGPISGQIAARIDTIGYYMVDLFIWGSIWVDTLSKMLLGMALLKIGFLSGRLPIKSYVVIGAVSLSVASIYYVLAAFLDAEEPVQTFLLNVTSYLHYLGGATAWSALIVGAVVWGWKAKALKAVGRTAFTVYILQSVIGLLLFSSLGLGLFGQLSLLELMGVAIGVWAFFLFAAPLWLKAFRFGPLEWVWRSLTYGQVQAFRR